MVFLETPQVRTPRRSEAFGQAPCSDIFANGQTSAGDIGYRQEWVMGDARAGSQFPPTLGRDPCAPAFIQPDMRYTEGAEAFAADCRRGLRIVMETPGEELRRKMAEARHRRRERNLEVKQMTTAFAAAETDSGTR